MLSHTGQTWPHVVSLAHHLDFCDQLRKMMWVPGDQPNSGSIGCGLHVYMEVKSHLTFPSWMSVTNLFTEKLSSYTGLPLHISNIKEDN